MKLPDTRPFHFRQFSLYHHRSTMKVGTDAVLLGIWTPVAGVKRVLDIGTGCGILSLLLAARSKDARLDAVDLDAASVQEAAANFMASPFSGRLNAIRSDITSYHPPENRKYDLIISNPPFFTRDHRPERPGRKLARHTDTLSYWQLVEAVHRLLRSGGHFSVVLPYRQSKEFVALAENTGLFLQRQMLIFPKPCKEPNRVNLLLGTSPGTVAAEKLIIRNEDGTFSSRYLEMVKKYYLST